MGCGFFNSRVQNRLDFTYKMNVKSRAVEAGGAFCQFPFWWIYYCHSSKSTGKEILGLLGMYFDAVVEEVKTFLL